MTFQSIKHPESGGSGSCGNWLRTWRERLKTRNITSCFSRSTNSQSQVTTNTSCNAAVVGLCKNKGRVERLWGSLTRSFTHSARRELAYHYCKCCDPKRRPSLLVLLSFTTRSVSPLACTQTVNLLKNTLCWCSIISPVGRCGARHRGSLLSGAAGPLLQVATPPRKHRRLLGLMYI